MKKILFFFAILVYAVKAQIPLKDGKCPDITRCLNKFKVPLNYQSVSELNLIFF